jgi:Protein of unknown function (DUF3808)
VSMTDTNSSLGSKTASPFHLIGLGATIFLQAALGMEAGVVEEAVKALNEAEAAARSQVKSSKSVKSSTRYPPGTEWEIIHADAVVLQGLTNALSETYYGKRRAHHISIHLTHRTLRILTESVSIFSRSNETF